MRRAANRIRIRVLLGLLGTAVLPSDSWCQEPHASATFQAFRFSEVPWTMSIDSDGVSAVKPAEAGKHPELRVMIRSSDFGGCSFVDNRDGRYRMLPGQTQLHPQQPHDGRGGPPHMADEREKALQLWIEIRRRRPESVGKPPVGERIYFVPDVFMVDANDSDAVNGFLEARRILGERCVDTPLAPMPR
jgi:hypothetical protein